MGVTATAIKALRALDVSMSIGARDRAAES
jgi:hypothetical protein